MGCLYWVFIGWWLEPIKWIVKLELKLLYWIYIGWWVKIIYNETARKWCFRIFGGIIFASLIVWMIQKHWWIIIPILILILCGITLLFPQSQFFIKSIKNHIKPKTIFKIENPAENNKFLIPSHLTDNIDSYFFQAGKFLIEKKEATPALLQREYKIGFSRALHILEQLEDCKVIESGYGTVPRKTLMTAGDFESLIRNYNGQFKEYHYEPSVEPQNNHINCKNDISIGFDYDNMDGHAFEHFCAELLRKNGFENVEVTKGSGDHGIDILAEKDNISYAIQCKCYSSNIGNAAVQQAHTGKSLYHKDIAVVLTNRYFTPQAKEEAQQLGVKLWDRDKLNNLINTYSNMNEYDLERYAIMCNAHMEHEEEMKQCE